MLSCALNLFKVEDAEESVFHQLSSLFEISQGNAFITSDAYLSHSVECEFCEYHRSDGIYRSKNWRGVHSPALLLSNPIKKKSNLILGHSDMNVRIIDSLVLAGLGYQKIFGINVSPFSKISSPLPLGLTNNTEESEFHRLFGNNSLMLEASQNEVTPGDFSGIVYGNFSISTNRSARQPLASILLDSGNIFEEPVMSIKGRLDFLSKLRRYGFTVCPVGNGIDTHRLWEVLYMGGVPIILANALLEELLIDLPFLVIQDWRQILDLDFLEREWDRLANVKSYNYEKLKIGYWTNFLHS